MIRVNLLPHREMRRRRQQKQFFITLGVVVALGATVWLMVHTSLAGTFEDQVARNAYLTEEIAKLDKEIEDIQRLKDMTAALLSRKKVVETLQSNRADAVHLLDELPRQLPEGIYLSAVRQAGNRVTLYGYTQSQARVSTLMRNLEASPYLENANLIEIKAVQTPRSRINEFTLNVDVARSKDAPAQGADAAADQAAAR